MLPALAFGVSGDSWQNATPLPPLPWANSVDGTLTPVVDGADTYYDYWHTIDMTAGQTISVTATLPAGGVAGFGFFPKSFTANGAFLFSDTVDATHQKLAIMAPRTGTYFLFVSSSAPGAYALDAKVILAVNYPMSAFSVPKTAKKKKNFTVAVKVSPDYDSIFTPVRFYVERKSGRRWKKYSSVQSSFAGGSSTYSKFSAKLKLPKATFRVRARFLDAAHPHAKYTSWKTVRVK